MTLTALKATPTNARKRVEKYAALPKPMRAATASTGRSLVRSSSAAPSRRRRSRYW